MKYATFRQSQTLASNAFIEAFSRHMRWSLHIGSFSEQLQALTSRKAQRLSERKYIPNTMTVSPTAGPRLGTLAVSERVLISYCEHNALAGYRNPAIAMTNFCKQQGKQIEVYRN
jgi:hypothetical protein